MKGIARVTLLSAGILLSILVLDRLFQPTRGVELHMLSVAQDVGFSVGAGWDELVPAFLSHHSSRYAPEIIRMLGTAKPGSWRESTALATVEMVLAEPGVKQALREFGCAHDDSHAVSSVAMILNRPQRIEIFADDSGRSAHIIPLNQRPRTLEEGRALLQCEVTNDA